MPRGGGPGAALTRTPGGVDKLAVYEALGVGEVWVWRSGTLEVWLLGDAGYARARRSALFPALDLERLATHLDEPSQTAAVRAFRGWIRQDA